MNKMENTLIQSMIRGQRSRNEYHWPGKAMKAPAVTRYPNILAEIDASGMYLWCPAEHAGVSQEIMAAVLEDGEELSYKELLGLVRLYGCGLAYLASPELSMVDAATNRSESKCRVLTDLMKRADGLDYCQWRVELAVSALDEGTAINTPPTAGPWMSCAAPLAGLKRHSPAAHGKPGKRSEICLKGQHLSWTGNLLTAK